MAQQLHPTAPRLGKNPIFAKTPPELRQRIVAASTRSRYPVGQRILSEGDLANRLFFLESGAVRVFHASPGGREVVLRIFRAPALFGEAEAFAGLPFTENVTALAPCEILETPVELMLDIVRENADIAAALLLDVCARFATSIQHQKSLAFDPATVRLANYLLAYAAWTNADAGGDLKIALQQDEMAAAIGATRRSVAKDMIAWQKEGLLERRGNRYLIRDLDGLKRYSNPNDLGPLYQLGKPILPIALRFGHKEKI